jgi:hypothetical protein
MSLRPWCVAGLVGHHLRADYIPQGAGHLAVTDAEVVVPEERHLFLERASGVDHPKQPTLPRVVDVRARRELPARRHAHVLCQPDLRIHIVGLLFEIDEIVDYRRIRQSSDGLQVRRACTEPRASKQVVE